MNTTGDVSVGSSWPPAWSMVTVGAVTSGGLSSSVIRIVAEPVMSFDPGAPGFTFETDHAALGLLDGGLMAEQQK